VLLQPRPALLADGVRGAAGSRTSRGKPIVNMFPLEEGEKITAVVPVKEFDENHYVFMATAQGTVKKTPACRVLAAPAERNHRGRPGRRRLLVGVALTDGKFDVMLFSSEGKAVRFEEADVRPMGRQATGVRGMRLGEGQRVVGMLAAKVENAELVEIGAHRDRERLRQAHAHRRVHAPRPRRPGPDRDPDLQRNGALVGAALVDDNDEVMLISTGGVLIRTKVAQIREQGRSTQGVTLISLDQGEKLAGLERIEERDVVEGNGNGGNGGPHAEGQGNGNARPTSPPSSRRRLRRSTKPYRPLEVRYSLILLKLST